MAQYAQARRRPKADTNASSGSRSPTHPRGGVGLRLPRASRLPLLSGSIPARC